MKTALALAATSMIGSNIALGSKNISTENISTDYIQLTDSIQIIIEEVSREERQQTILLTDTVDLTMTERTKKVVDLPVLLKGLKQVFHSGSILKNSSISLTNSSNKTLKWNNPYIYVNNLYWILNYTRGITKVTLEVSSRNSERNYVVAHYKDLGDCGNTAIIGQFNWSSSENISSYWTSDIKCIFELEFE